MLVLGLGVMSAIAYYFDVRPDGNAQTALLVGAGALILWRLVVEYLVRQVPQ